uniref:Uncharacterized protein n=1 Tax=Trichobilharzia regenti TaxID=157069 RepID=A0AA85JAJ8_TRIRE|nr:unnamed protein product [Trichobilharzia regenti]
MHTPWQSQYKPSVMPTETTVQKSASSSSTSSSCVVAPMERIQSARPQQFLIEHSVVTAATTSSNGNAAEDSPSSVVITSSKNGINHHYHPSTSKSILEEIRIMDELPTPFPAYVASAPTATPALKPPGLNYNLNNHNNHNNNIGISSSMIPKSIETVIQQAHVPSASSVSNDAIISHTRHRHYSSNNSSSFSSASTSPRSSCSSSQLNLLDPAVSTDPTTSESHQTTVLSNTNPSSSLSPRSSGSVVSSSLSPSSASESSTSAPSTSATSSSASSASTHSSVGPSTANIPCNDDQNDDGDDEVFVTKDKEGGVTDDLVHETSADKDLSPPISPCVSEPSQTQSQGVVDKDANHDNNHADCLAITEPTIIQDPLEAQFLPIDSESHILGSHLIQVSHLNISSQNVNQSIQLNTPYGDGDALTTDNTTSSVSPNSNGDDNFKQNKNMNDRIQSVEAEKSLHDQQPTETEDEDDDGDGDDDDLNDIVHYQSERLSPVSFDRGTVTTIDSHLSSIMAQDEYDNQRENSMITNHNHSISTTTNTDRDSSCYSKHTGDDVGSVEFPKSPPHACLDIQSDNPEDWDLDVADRELLAADGLLYLDRSHPVSIQQCVSFIGPVS